MAINKEELLKNIKDKYRKLNLFFSILSILAMLAYPSYCLIVNKGNQYINIGVLVVSGIYGILWLILGSKKKYKINRIYKWSRLFLTLVSLCINAYSIYVTATNFNITAIIMSGILTGFWILNVIFNILYDIATRKWEQFLAAKKQDINELKTNLNNKKKLIIDKINEKKTKQLEDNN